MFSEYTDKLEQRLKNPLPGSGSQFKMAPSARIKMPDLKSPFKARESAVLILIFPVHEMPHIVFIERASYDGKHSGEISLPGGKAEPGDINIDATALRESEEEVGVIQADIKIIGRLTELYIPFSHFCVQPIVGIIDYEPVFIPNKLEVKSIIIAGIAELLDPANRQTEDIKIADNNINAPFYSVKGHHIWGATSMIMSEFLEIVGNI
ncbi:MAG: CoA pyrophosphatase [Bacteroidia bacterium]|nr:CoA pyrophosphatase [Bacteroidia bacterium]